MARGQKKAGERKSPILRDIPMACVDETAAAEFLERLRWPDEPCCPKCGIVDVYRMQGRDGKREKHLRWRCKGCHATFSVRTTTVLAETRIPLSYWCHAIWRACASKKGIAAKQLEREIDVSYKTALYMLHRLRHAMGGHAEPMAKMTGTVEVDETYVGGKPRHRSTDGDGAYRGDSHYSKRKTPVLAIVNRGGKVRASRLPPANKEHIYAAVRRAVDTSRARLMTDEAPFYREIGKEFAGGHETVCHSAGEYARGDASSNTAESFFAIVKRGHYGIFHHYSKKHLPNYLNEHEFRWNTRKVDDGERVVALVRAAEGKRLPYKEHVGRD